MKETIFRKKFKPQEMNIDNDMDGAAETSYQFAASPVFKSPLTTDASVLLVAKHNHKEADSLDFLMSRDKCVELINYLQGIIDYIDERNSIQRNLLERFEMIRKCYEDGEIEKIDVSLCDENPLSYNGDGNKPCLLKFEPVATVTCTKFFTAFYAILYVTGVYEADKKIFGDILKDIPLVYDNALKRRGERIKKEQLADAMKAMDERAERFKEQMKK